MEINYEKYTNMNRQQLFKALISTEKKEEKIKRDFSEKLKRMQQLRIFLTEKIKESLEEIPNLHCVDSQGGNNGN